MDPETLSRIQFALTVSFHFIFPPLSMGLGLMLVYGCANAHGGEVSVVSTPAEGTTFTLDLPLDARPYQSSTVAPVDPSLASAVGRSVRGTAPA